LEETITKRSGEVAQGVGPEFKPQYQKKKKKRIHTYNFLNSKTVPGKFF
jgi:hypothetical protein